MWHQVEMIVALRCGITPTFHPTNIQPTLHNHLQLVFTIQMCISICLHGIIICG
jgi:hypothetical protein